MSTRPLPRWVYDIIGALEQYEDEHAMGALCMNAALDQVPQRERDCANILRHYGAKPPEEQPCPPENATPSPDSACSCAPSAP